MAAVLLVACGGGVAQTTQPSSTPTPTPSSSGPRTADPEDYAAISGFFGRRRPAVSQCYADALAAKKVDPKGRGYVTVSMVVPTSGKPTNVHIAGSTIKSPMIEECVVKLVNRWVVPPPSAAIDFSFSYNFLPE